MTGGAALFPRIALKCSVLRRLARKRCICYGKYIGCIYMLWGNTWLSDIHQALAQHLMLHGLPCESY